MTLDLRRVPDRHARRPNPSEECPIDAAVGEYRYARLAATYLGSDQGAAIGSIALATKVVSQIAMASSTVGVDPAGPSARQVAAAASAK